MVEGRLWLHFGRP